MEFGIAPVWIKNQWNCEDNAQRHITKVALDDLKQNYMSEWACDLKEKLDGDFFQADILKI